MTLGEKLPRVAGIVALLLAGGVLISAVAGQVAMLPSALIPLFAGIGILRRRVWSAYGFAVYCLGQILVGAVVLARGVEPSSLALVLGAVGFNVLLGGLFTGAGRTLARSGAVRGQAWPWIAGAAMFSVPVLFVQAFVIPSGAMENTLLIGDKLLVRRFPRPEVRRDDVVVFEYPVDRRQMFVKRILGVPGDHIKLVNKVVYRNGVPLTEAYVLHATEYEDRYRDDFPGEPNTSLAAGAGEMLAKHVVGGEVVVPQGSYFVLGDNRDNSLDSRYWGFVPVGNVIGKPVLIYASSDAASGKTRWARIFRTL